MAPYIMYGSAVAIALSFTERLWRGGWLLAALPALLLSGVALRQIQLTRTESLSPWKGGGFGMFASTDSRANRFLRVYVRAPERHAELEIPRSLEELAARVAVLPNEQNLRRLAAGVAAREKRHARSVTTVTIEVWRTHYERKTLRPSDHLLRELSVDVGD